MSLASDTINITQSGIRGTLTTDFGLEVIFDWGEFFKVTVSSSFYKNLVGMCGTYNDDQQDDFVTPAGIETSSVTEWANSWSVPDSDHGCWPFPPCLDEEKQLFSGPTYCGLLEDQNGPFANCSHTVTLGKFVHDCLFFTCLTKGSRDNYCKIMSSYVSSCESTKSVVSSQWKSITKC